MIYLNIITACSRQFNLKIIEQSINIPRSNYRWIVIFDSKIIPNIKYMPKNAEYYNAKHEKSIYGTYQKNYGLKLVKHGHVYINDDDTTIHKELWENIKDLENDFISFKQQYPDGSHRLDHKNIDITGIDSHNFIVSNSLIQNKSFCNLYTHDGIFAKWCYSEAKNPIHIDKYLSIYNSLRR